MIIAVEQQMQKYTTWSADNLGKQTGTWYSFYLVEMGGLLNKFNLYENISLNNNFFEYQSFEEFKQIYKQLTEDTDEAVKRILAGKAIRYPDSFKRIDEIWKNKCVQKEVEQGKKKSDKNFGGVAALGTILRAYLKFLYYQENTEIEYPGKTKNDQLKKEFDDEINYWIYSVGEKIRLWDTFYKEEIIAIGWDYLGDLHKYNNREEVAKVKNDTNGDGINHRNDARTVWEFYNDIKIGDIIYVKCGIRKIIGKGIVRSAYYFDDAASEYKHRYSVDWIEKGNWMSKHNVPLKVLTNINDKPEDIIYFDSLITGNVVDEDTLLIYKFKDWLSKQVQQNGDLLSDRTIQAKVSALKDLQKYYNILIFQETETDVLRDLKERALADDGYTKYKGITSSAIDYYIRFIESMPTIEENEAYSMDDFLSEVFMDKSSVVQLQSLLQHKKNIIIKGAPGVGKTFIADRLAYLMMEEKDDSRIQMIQFHQSYSYEDFIEGYRPKAEGEGFELKEGPFVKFARKAANDLDRDYFFIIDEINRGNLSKIFGELLMLIECDKRNKSINLLYSNDKFYVPDNLYIIGMMNTADRSLALLDYALRRRFAFFEFNPAFENKTFNEYITKQADSEKIFRVIHEVTDLNRCIVEELGRGFQIGHSYFIDDAFQDNTETRIKEIVEYEIIPQLYEYWFDNEDKADDWANKLRGACSAYE